MRANEKMAINSHKEVRLARYSLAQARDQLSRLVDEALAGEPVTITRHGKPVAIIAPAPSEPRRITSKFLDKLSVNRQRRGGLGADAVTLIRQMRDEDP